MRETKRVGHFEGVTGWRGGRSDRGPITDPLGLISSRFPTPPGRHRQPQEDQHGLIETQDILVVQAADTRADFRFRDGGDLVHHQAARCAQPVALVGLVMESVPSKLSSCTMPA